MTLTPPFPITRLDLRQLYRALLRAHAAAAPPNLPAVSTLAAYRTALYAGGSRRRPLFGVWLAMVGGGTG